MYKILVFGTGGLSHFLTKSKKPNVSILAYLNSMESGYEIEGTPVVPVEELHNYEYDYIVIAFSDIEKGKEMLLFQGVAEEKIIGYHFNGAYNYSNNRFQNECNKLLQQELHTEMIECLFDVPEKRYYLCSMNIPDVRDMIEFDFVREQTLGLLAIEIYRKNIGGAVAELGVFRGQFAKKINKLFPDRECYLFDTFEGFSTEEIESDSTFHWGTKLDQFKDTTVEKVLSVMPNREMCTVKKGFFPETYDLAEKMFCFVSIDVDLYDPIKTGLEIFYPRLTRGGYIMVHDYNNLLYDGTKKAVQEYCDAQNISYVPIPDMAGSIVITK